MKLKCSYCGKNITGKYTGNFWGDSYCIEHMNSVPQCHYCGRLISSKTSRGGKTYIDNRNICGICLSNAVVDYNSGLEILGKVHKTLGLDGIEISPFNPEFALMERKKLRTVYSDDSERQGFAKFKREVTADREILNFRLQIFIIDGLPEANFISTCAHELMHIWLYSHNITDTSPMLTEGSCNMASYLVLRREQTPESEFVIKNLFESKNRIYGGGFRKVHRLVDKRGIPEWLKYLKTRKRI